MRNTRQRTAIKKVLETNEHLSADEVFNLIKDKCQIDLSTVYRNLNSMVKNGEIEKIMDSNGTAKFHSRAHHHGHLICLGCREIYEIPCDVCSKLHDISKSMDFDDKEHSINIYGYCKKCRGGR